MATAADMLTSKNTRVDHGATTPHGGDSDYDLTSGSGQEVVERSDCPRSKSVPAELALTTEGVFDNDEGRLMNSFNGSPQETASPRLKESPTRNGHRPTPGRSQTNGRQSANSRPQTLPNTPRNGASDRSLNSSHKKKSGNWFSLSYKQKSEEFHKLFKDIPSEERLLVDYSCAMQKDLLVHGKLYISQNWICFYANILFKWETMVVIPCNQIKSITKEKTARVIPNAIQINTATDKYFFSTFNARDKTYLMMFRVWQNVLLGQPMGSQQLWQWVHQLYGTQLGLTASDDDYQPPDSTQESDNPPTPDVASETGVNYQLPTMLAANEGLPTLSDVSEVPHHEVSSDCTDTTEDDCDEDEVECPDGHEHADWVTLDLVVNFSVNQLFDLLFTDNSFFRSFLDSQGTTDIVLGEWNEEPDSEGSKCRNNSFTIALNASFGPKSTPSNETQYIRKDSKPGSFYCVDCESLSDPSLPYGENFYVWNRYCIARLSKNTCRVTVRSKICYRKSVFALVRAIIEKNVRNGVNGYFKPLTETLAQESDKMAANLEQPRKKKRYTKHRAAPAHRVTSRPSIGAVISKKSLSNSQPPTEPTSTRRNAYITSTVRVMSALLIFLVMFNLLLFFKLWSLESRHEAMQFDSSNSGLYTHQDLLDLLNKQKHLYEEDISHWKLTLESSSELIKQLQDSIEEIKVQQQTAATYSNSDGSTKVKVDL